MSHPFGTVYDRSTDQIDPYHLPQLYKLVGWWSSLGPLLYNMHSAHYLLDDAQRRTLMAAVQTPHAIGNHLMSLSTDMLKLNLQPLDEDISEIYQSLRTKLVLEIPGKRLNDPLKRHCKRLIKLSQYFSPLRNLVVDLDVVALAWAIAMMKGLADYDLVFSHPIIETANLLERMRMEELEKIWRGQRPGSDERLDIVRRRLERRFDLESLTLEVDLPAKSDWERDLAEGKVQVLGMVVSLRSFGSPYELM